MNDDGLDRDIRDAVEPDPATVARVVRGALEHGGGQWTWSRSIGVAAGALTVLVVATLLFTTSGRRQDVVGPRSGSAVTQITNINDTVVVRPTSGGVWLVGGGQKSSQLPPGTIVVHKSGDAR